MRQQNKSPLGCCSSQADDGGKNLLAENFFSAAYFNPESANCQSWQIAEILGHGAENAITTAEIKSICSFSSRRAVRNEIARERANGVLICSNSHGLFLPSLDEKQRRQEIAQCLRTGEARAFTFLRTLDCFRQELKQCEGQAELFEASENATT